MKSVKTSTGFECVLDESVLDDMELFDAIADMEEGKTIALPKVMSKILGENKKAFYDHLRNKETGRVPFEAAATELSEIITQLGKK